MCLRPAQSWSTTDGDQRNILDPCTRGMGSRLLLRLCGSLYGVAICTQRQKHCLAAPDTTLPAMVPYARDPGGSTETTRPLEPAQDFWHLRSIQSSLDARLGEY